MALADYQPLTRKVTLRNGDLSLRGLGLDDVAVLMNEHLPDIDSIVSLYDDNMDSGSRVAATAQFALILTRQAPALVATIIARAADEPDQVDKARSMGIAAQVECLKAVLEMTFEEAGGFRKFVENLTMILQGMAPAPQKQASHT